MKFSSMPLFHVFLSSNSQTNEKTGWAKFLSRRWSMSDVSERTKVSNRLFSLFNFNSFRCCNECCHMKKTLYIHIFSDIYLWVTDFCWAEILHSATFFRFFCVAYLFFSLFLWRKNYKMVISFWKKPKKTWKTTSIRVEIYCRQNILPDKMVFTVESTRVSLVLCCEEGKKYNQRWLP